MRAILAQSIGAAARQTGCSVPTIRYYEQVGLLPAAARTEANQRQYDEAAIRRLTFIRRCREFGFSIEQVRELVGLAGQPDRDCAEVRDIAQAQLAAVRRKLVDLHALESDLSAFVTSCDTSCAGGPVACCTIFEDLGAPGIAADAGPSGQARRSCCP